MKKIILKYSIIFLGLTILAGCSKKDGIDSDLSFLNTVASANVTSIFDISNDNSGNVKITPTGEGVSAFTVSYGEGTGSPATVSPGSSTTHAYPEGNYTVTIIAVDLVGKETSTTYPLQVTYRAPENIEVGISDETRITASAQYAKSFLVYYGDVANEVGTPLAIGAKAPAHTYPASGGPFTLKVEALSGGAAKSTYTKTLLGFPMDFESTSVDYFTGTFGDGQKFEKVTNPKAAGLNTSATVGKFTRGAQGWSGTYTPLNIPVNFSYGKKVKLLAYNPDTALIGKKLNVELEWAVGGTPANGVAVVKTAFTKSGEWEELVFDFSGISGIPAATKFTQLVLRFNDSADGAGAAVYVDNFRLTN